ncbi:hypothetical protein AABD41_00115 [Staphylococcus pseudoxylosus]|uniref:hypothetical protein n=1 Tax=Staphylococcus pseudoxylosus TaxID=2282419 RepID=UPI00398B72AA
MGRVQALATGLGKAYYAVLTKNKLNGSLEAGEIKDIDYVQEMSLEFGEELEKAYGSNTKVAEIAKLSW